MRNEIIFKGDYITAEIMKPSAGIIISAWSKDNYRVHFRYFDYELEEMPELLTSFVEHFENELCDQAKAEALSFLDAMEVTS